MKIMLELEPHEAMLLLDPIQGAALDDQRIAAKAKGEKADHASMRAQVRQRVATQILDAFDTCQILDDPDCLRPIERDGLCAFHLRRLEEQRARLAVTA